ncbi:MAG: ribonuclease HII [Candidatus Lokiarchaeota archaeon]
MEKLISGIDEAGRGPVLGPMIICCVCFTENSIKFLEKIGVKDSKKLTPKKRLELATLIKNECVCYNDIEVTSQEIDRREENGLDLNKLEIVKMGEMLNNLKPSFIYIDAADVNERRFKRRIEARLNYQPDKVIAKHKADDLFPIVSAASIIAKHKRDKIIEELRERYINLGYGDLGSGYTSDERTISFLRNWIRKHRQPPRFARITWETTRKILNEEVYNQKITDFF